MTSKFQELLVTRVEEVKKQLHSDFKDKHHATRRSDNVVYCGVYLARLKFSLTLELSSMMRQREQKEREEQKNAVLFNVPEKKKKAEEKKQKRLKEKAKEKQKRLIEMQNDFFDSENLIKGPLCKVKSFSTDQIAYDLELSIPELLQWLMDYDIITDLSEISVAPELDQNQYIKLRKNGSWTIDGYYYVTKSYRLYCKLNCKELPPYGMHQDFLMAYETIIDKRMKALTAIACKVDNGLYKHMKSIRGVLFQK